jgi:hypothetical protein
MLREDLDLADRDLRETDSNIGALHKLFLRNSADPVPQIHDTFYDSNGSDESVLSGSDESG